MFIYNRHYIKAAFICLGTWGMMEGAAQAQHPGHARPTPVQRHAAAAGRPMPVQRHTPSAARPVHTVKPPAPAKTAAPAKEVARRSPAGSPALRKAMPPADRRIFRAPNSQDIVEGRRHHWWHHHHWPWWWGGFNPWGGIPIGVPLAGAAASAPASLSTGGGGEGSADQTESASILQAQGDYEEKHQRAEILRTQNKQELVKLRRMKVEQDLFDRDNVPTAEDNREQAGLERLRRHLNSPPLTEIHSAEALNTLLDYLKAAPNGIPVRARARLDADALSRINVAGGKGDGLGIFKEDGRLEWTAVLKDAAFETERTSLEQLAGDAFRAAERGRMLDPDSLKGLTRGIDELEAALKQQATQFAPSRYIEAKRYLRGLDTAVSTLARGDAASASKDLLRCRTVADLVKRMATGGLRFAAALPGDEDAYVALHTALVSACEPAVAELTTTR